jgi:hypothetical protein
MAASFKQVTIISNQHRAVLHCWEEVDVALTACSQTMVNIAIAISSALEVCLSMELFTDYAEHAPPW